MSVRVHRDCEKSRENRLDKIYSWKTPPYFVEFREQPKPNERVTCCFTSLFILMRNAVKLLRLFHVWFIKRNCMQLSGMTRWSHVKNSATNEPPECLWCNLTSPKRGREQPLVYKPICTYRCSHHNTFSP